MHRIECPGCHKSLKLPREVRDAKLKCPKCGHIFVGSSHEVDEPAASPAPAKPSGAARPERPDSPTSFDPAAALAAAAMNAESSKPAAAPAQQAQGAGAAPAVVYRRKKSNMPAFVAVGLALMLIPVIGLLIYNVTHKTLILKTPDGKIVFEGRVSNEEAAVMEAEHRKKYDPMAIQEKPATGAAGAKEPKVPAAAHDGGSVSAAGAVGVATVKGDQNFTLESVQMIPNDEGGGGRYVGVVRSKYDCVVESVQLKLQGCQESPKLTWIAPHGVVPFTVSYNSEGTKKEQAPEAMFSDTKLAKEYGGWDIADEPNAPETPDKSIVLKGTTTNTTGQKIVSAKIYTDFATDTGMTQATIDASEMATHDFAPGGKSDYTVTWTPNLKGLPHKHYLRVIGLLAK